MLDNENHITDGNKQKTPIPDVTVSEENLVKCLKSTCDYELLIKNALPLAKKEERFDLFRTILMYHSDNDTYRKSKSNRKHFIEKITHTRDSGPDLYQLDRDIKRSCPSLTEKYNTYLREFLITEKWPEKDNNERRMICFALSNTNHHQKLSPQLEGEIEKILLSEKWLHHYTYGDTHCHTLLLSLFADSRHNLGNNETIKEYILQQFTNPTCIDYSFFRVGLRFLINRVEDKTEYQKAIKSLIQLTHQNTLIDGSSLFEVLKNSLLEDLEDWIEDGVEEGTSHTQLSSEEISKLKKLIMYEEIENREKANKNSLA